MTKHGKYKNLCVFRKEVENDLFQFAYPSNINQYKKSVCLSEPGPYPGANVAE